MAPRPAQHTQQAFRCCAPSLALQRQKSTCHHKVQPAVMQHGTGVAIQLYVQFRHHSCSYMHPWLCKPCVSRAGPHNMCGCCCRAK